MPWSLALLLFLVIGMVWDSFRERAEQATFEKRFVTTAATVVGSVRAEAEAQSDSANPIRVRLVD
ncbi:hypothetical protein [Nocardiopsis alkaliphila]|uniref:hypothetical protein n=1 Tax=Nocardiopsis alkaliphila TaxID=225762 RepID=UPI000347D405|nr:hypothetical protein [Nocardiopsis alkaliphila]